MVRWKIECDLSNNGLRRFSQILRGHLSETERIHLHNEWRPTRNRSSMQFVRFFRKMRDLDKRLPQRQPTRQNLALGNEVQNFGKRLRDSKRLFPRNFAAHPQKLLQRKSFDPFTD